MIDEDAGCPYADSGIDDYVSGLMDRCRALWHFERAHAVFLHKAGSNLDKSLADALPEPGAEHRYPGEGENIILRQVGRVVVIAVAGNRAVNRAN